MPTNAPVSPSLNALQQPVYSSSNVQNMGCTLLGDAAPATTSTACSHLLDLRLTFECMPAHAGFHKHAPRPNARLALVMRDTTNCGSLTRPIAFLSQSLSFACFVLDQERQLKRARPLVWLVSARNGGQRLHPFVAKGSRDQWQSG